MIFWLADRKTSDYESGISHVLQKLPDLLCKCERINRVPHHCDCGRKWQPPPMSRLNRLPSDDKREQGDHETNDDEQFMADSGDADNGYDRTEQTRCECHAAEGGGLVRAQTYSLLVTSSFRWCFGIE